MYYLSHGFMPQVKGQFESGFPEIFRMKFQTPNKKAETRQILGDITDLGIIPQIFLYRNYLTLGIHLNKNYLLELSR